MVGVKSENSQRARNRAARRDKRLALAARRDALFDMAASGFSIEAIGAQFALTPRRVRSEMARTVQARRLDAPDHFMALQIARLHKALRAAEAAVDRNDLRGVSGMIRIVAALDRYHLAPPPERSAPPALDRNATPPLALTHAASRDS